MHGTAAPQASQDNLCITRSALYPEYVGVEPIIAESARKHDVSDQDILHAYRHPIRVFELDEDFTMVIGANQAAIIFEIGVVDGVEAPVIVHAMRAREKFLR